MRTASVWAEGGYESIASPPPAHVPTKFIVTRGKKNAIRHLAEGACTNTANGQKKWAMPGLKLYAITVVELPLPKGWLKDNGWLKRKVKA